MLKELPPNSQWMAVGVAKEQLPVNALSIILGGHVRTGFEDNIYYRRGEKGTSNAQMVARVVRLCNELNRPVATAAEARQILGLRDAKDPASRAYQRPLPAQSTSGPVVAFFGELPALLAGSNQPGLLPSYQFLLRGEGGGAWWVKIDNGVASTGAGEIKTPAVYIVGPASDWLGVVNGTIHPLGAVQTGNILVSDTRFSGYGAMVQAIAAGKKRAAALG